jgi:hypothetical protein
MHATPLEPQAAFESPCLHVWVAVSQQPDEQLATVQTHDPLLHSVPAGHEMQTAPLVPHAVSVLPPTQVPLSQHPPGQLVAVQTHDPLLHSVPAGHEMQTAPPVPHAASALPPTQVPLSQQPPGQLAGVQIQL